MTEEPSPTPSSAEQALDSLETDRIRGLIDRLAPAQRDVMMLRIVAGMTLPKIAELLGRTVGGVKALQRRAVASLRRIIKREGVSP